jgi:hypothetical protein
MYVYGAQCNMEILCFLTLEVRKRPKGDVSVRIDVRRSPGVNKNEKMHRRPLVLLFSRIGLNIRPVRTQTHPNLVYKSLNVPERPRMRRIR